MVALSHRSAPAEDTSTVSSSGDTPDASSAASSAPLKAVSSFTSGDP